MSEGSAPRRALLVGASRGLGLGLAARFLDRGWDVTATTRRPSTALQALRTGSGSGRLLVEEGVDIDDDGALAALDARLSAARFDILFVVAGVATGAGTPASIVERSTALAVYNTNALGPIRCAHALHRRVPAGGLVVLMTSRHGSVSLNRGGGWGIYRASKAALNTLARSFASEHAKGGFGTILIHPGWVRTDLGGRRATLDVETSVRGMVAVLEARLGTTGCAYLDYTGATLPW